MTKQNSEKVKYNCVLYIPEIMHREFKVTDAGRVILDLKINPAKKVLGRLANKEPVSSLELDELSSSVWLGIDGKQSILDIARNQRKKTSNNIDRSARKIALFMRYIVNKGWIKFKLAEHNPNLG